MSIFKDIKEDLEHAVEEVGEDQTTEGAEETYVPDDYDSDLVSELIEEEKKNSEKAETPAEETKGKNKFKENGKKETEEKDDEEKKEDAASEKKHASLSESSLKDMQENKDSVTVITKGTTINGSIISDCSLDVMGTINGDVECLGKLTVSGRVTGNLLASEVFINSTRLDGSITSEGSVKVGNNSIIVGDIVASSVAIVGAVKGDIDVKGPVIMDSTAAVKGNIKAKSVQMNNGAILEGYCSLAYSDYPIDTIFE